MQVVNPSLVANKTVLLRLDLDVPIENGKVLDDFRLLAGMDTLGLCLNSAKTVIIMGHIGRPGGKEDPLLSVKPIVTWLQEGYGHIQLPEGKLHILENLRFEPGEDASDENFAKEIISLTGGDFYVNDAFASYHTAASITVLPKLLPHAMGLNFAHEIQELTKIRENPDKPLVSIMGGAKVEDKLPVIESLAKVSDAVLVGGKLAAEIKQNPEISDKLPKNVMVGMLTEDGLDISPSTTDSWKTVIHNAKMIVWNGPLGKFEEEKNNQSKYIAQAIIDSGAKSIIGGGDTITMLDKWDMLDKFSFVSSGGGAMLKFLESGTLDSLEALK